MAYKVIILYQLYMPSYFLGTFTEYPSVTFVTFVILLTDRGVPNSLPTSLISKDQGSFVYNRKPVP